MKSSLISHTPFTQPHVVPNMYAFFSSVEHKRRYSEECFCTYSVSQHFETQWLSLYGLRNKTERENIFWRKFVHIVKINIDFHCMDKKPKTFSKNLLCSTEEKKLHWFETVKMFIVRWIILLTTNTLIKKKNLPIRERKEEELALQQVHPNE